MSCEDVCAQGVAELGGGHGATQADLAALRDLYDASPKLQLGEDLATLRRQAKLLTTRFRQMGLKLPEHLNLDDPEGIVAIRYGRVYAELQRRGWLQKAGAQGAEAAGARRDVYTTSSAAVGDDLPAASTGVIRLPLDGHDRIPGGVERENGVYVSAALDQQSATPLRLVARSARHGAGIVELPEGQGYRIVAYDSDERRWLPRALGQADYAALPAALEGIRTAGHPLIGVLLPPFEADAAGGMVVTDEAGNQMRLSAGGVDDIIGEVAWQRLRRRLPDAQIPCSPGEVARILGDPAHPEHTAAMSRYQPDALLPVMPGAAGAYLQDGVMSTALGSLRDALPLDERAALDRQLREGLPVLANPGDGAPTVEQVIEREGRWGDLVSFPASIVGEAGEGAASHPSGWVVAGPVVRDVWDSVREVVAYHPEHGVIAGAVDGAMYGSSSEALRAFWGAFSDALELSDSSDA